MYLSGSHNPAVALGLAGGGAIRRQAAGGSERGSDELVLNITTGGRSEVKRRCTFHGHVHGGSGAFFDERRSPGQGVFAERTHSVARQTTIALGRFQTLGRRPPKKMIPQIERALEAWHG